MSSEFLLTKHSGISMLEILDSDSKISFLFSNLISEKQYLTKFSLYPCSVNLTVNLFHVFSENVLPTSVCKSDKVHAV